MKTHPQVTEAIKDSINNIRRLREDPKCAWGFTKLSEVRDFVRCDIDRAYQRLFGIPRVLAVLEDRLFEGLDIGLAKEWPLRFTAAIQEGADLSEVFPKFQRWLLIDPDYGVIRFAKTNKQRKVIEEAADIYLDWPNVDREKARLVRDAARAAAAADSYAYTAADAAADAAAYAAAYAAYAAADADYAADAAVYASYAAARKEHYRVMADKLIELIKAAPVRTSR